MWEDRCPNSSSRCSYCMQYEQFIAPNLDPCRPTSASACQSCQCPSLRTPWAGRLKAKNSFAVLFIFWAAYRLKWECLKCLVLYDRSTCRFHLKMSSLFFLAAIIGDLLRHWIQYIYISRIQLLFHGQIRVWHCLHPIMKEMVQ